MKGESSSQPMPNKVIRSGRLIMDRLEAGNQRLRNPDGRSEKVICSRFREHQIPLARALEPGPFFSCRGHFQERRGWTLEFPSACPLRNQPQRPSRQEDRGERCAWFSLIIWWRSNRMVTQATMKRAPPCMRGALTVLSSVRHIPSWV